MILDVIRLSPCGPSHVSLSWRYRASIRRRGAAMTDNVTPLPPIKVDLSGSELHRHVAMYRRLHGPPPTVDWADVESVTRWIEYVRLAAFFSGARHDEISRAEATELVVALSERTGA